MLHFQYKLLENTWVGLFNSSLIFNNVKCENNYYIFSCKSYDFEEWNIDIALTGITIYVYELNWPCCPVLDKELVHVKTSAHNKQLL